MAMLYTHSIRNQAIEQDGGVKMRDSVPSEGYSIICNLLRQWSISLIPTYRVYQLYDSSTTPLLGTSHVGASGLVYTYSTWHALTPPSSSRSIALGLLKKEEEDT